MTMDVSPIEQNYQYGLYGQGSKFPQFGEITAVGKRTVQATPAEGTISPYERIGTGELNPSVIGGSTGYNGPELRGGVTGAVLDLKF